ncbi:PH domain-containing protein, partial [Arthrospira platensis SPKY2]
LGLALAVLALGKLVFQRHYRRYILMPGYAKCEEGIIARKSTKIAYVNVVNYDVQQNPIARILNYGTIELSSAGSDGSEIRMLDVYSPRVVELVLESRMEE